MHAVILAAGQGTRLNKNLPKCLIEINGVTLVERQVAIFKSVGIKNITVVIGNGGVWTPEHHKLINNIKGIIVIINKRSIGTQSPYSLYLGIKDINDSIIVIDGDIVLEESTIRALSEIEDKSILLAKWNEDGTGSKVIFEENKKKSYILTQMSDQIISEYVYAGVIRIDNKIINLLREILGKGKFDDEQLEMPISELLNHTRIECIKLLSNYDGNELLELAVMAGGSYSKTSKVLKGKNKLPMIRKEITPQGESKLIDEIEWITNLPDPVKKHFPVIISQNINLEPTYYEMPCYSFPTLRTLLMDGEINSGEALQYLTKIFDFVFKELYTEKQPIRRNYIKEIHLRKIFTRLHETKNMVYSFRELIDAEQLIINGKEYTNILPIISQISQNGKIINLISPTSASRTHGDLHFDNILINREKDDFILVDPRGNFDYDITYDLGKIWHSCHGLYDFIHSGKFTIERDGLKLDYRFEESDSLKEYNIVLQSLPSLLIEYDEIKNDDSWLIKTLFSEASHFASVAPFHIKMDGNENLAILCYIRGVELMNDFYELALEKVKSEQVIEGHLINVNTSEDFQIAQIKFK